MQRRLTTQGTGQSQESPVAEIIEEEVQLIANCGVRAKTNAIGSSQDSHSPGTSLISQTMLNRKISGATSQQQLSTDTSQ